MASVVITFDPENKAEPFTYMAEKLDGNEYVVGNVVVEKPWCNQPQNHKYYIVTNEYNDSNFCGGRELTGFNMTAVNPDTIEPFTQIAKIKSCLRMNLTVELVKRDTDDNSLTDTIAKIEPTENIPMHLWS